MLVYDICNEKSFENIKNWIRNIEEVSSKLKQTFVIINYKLIIFGRNCCLIVLLCTESNARTAFT